MNLADVFTVLFIILGFAIVFVAYWLAAAALFPQLTQRCADRFGDSPLKATLLGLVVWVPILVIASMISNKAPNGALKLVGILIMLVSALVALAGSSGMALRIGAGLKSMRDEAEPWRRVLRGAIILALTFVLPFVGTLVMAWTFVAGFGTLLLPRPKQRAAAESEREPAPAPTPVPAAEAMPAAQ